MYIKYKKNIPMKRPDSFDINKLINAPLKVDTVEKKKDSFFLKKPIDADTEFSRKLISDTEDIIKNYDSYILKHDNSGDVQNIPTHEEMQKIIADSKIKPAEKKTIKDIKIKKKVEKLKPKTEIVYDTSPIGFDPIDLDGEISSKKTTLENLIPEIEKEKLLNRKPNDNSSRDSKMVIADLASSLGPSILSLLGTNTARAFNSQISKGNKYAQGRGKEEEVTKDKVSVIEDENEEPLNINTRDSIGEKPYFDKSKRKLSDLLSRDGDIKTFKNMYDKSTGESITVAVTKGNKIIPLGSGKDNSNVIPNFKDFENDQGVAIDKAVDYKGDTIFKQHDKNNPNKIKNVTSVTGLGGKMDMPQEAAKDKLEAMNTAAKKNEIDLEDIKELDIATDHLRYTSNAFKQAMIYNLLIRVVEKRVSDEEANAFGGDKYRTYAERGLMLLHEGVLNGGLDPKKKQEIIGVMDYLKEVKKKSIEHRRESENLKLGLNNFGKKVLKKYMDTPKGEKEREMKKINEDKILEEKKKDVGENSWRTKHRNSNTTSRRDQYR